jgi:hypothetical protein
LKQFKIDNDIKAEVKQWCLDNLGSETVRWWFQDDMLGYKSYASAPSILMLDVTEEEENNLTYFILRYGQ